MLTGLTDDDLAGRRIDEGAATRLLRSADVVVAHHSRFDRVRVEHRLPDACGLSWACSMEEIDWRGPGLDGRSLGYLLMQVGHYHDGHRAATDVDALVQLLRHRFDDGRTALSLMMERSLRDSWLVRARGASFEVKNRRKARGYRWDAGSRTWWREVPDVDRIREEFWLAANVYGAGLGARALGPDIERVNARSRMRAIFEEVRAEAERRLASIPPAADDRRGFGTVYAVGPAAKSEVVLSCWNLSVHRFADDPMGAAPGDSLATRMRVARAFADAANTIFVPEDVRFFARPLEVMSAGEETPAGLYPGEASDLPSIDLMPGRPDRHVVDTLVRERFRHDHNEGQSSDPYCMQREIWHILMRFNAARAMLDPSSRQVTMPDRSSIGRRLRILKDEAFASELPRDPAP